MTKICLALVKLLRARRQILLLLWNKFQQMINFSSSWNLQKTYGFQMIQGEWKLIKCAQVRLILEAIFGAEP